MHTFRLTLKLLLREWRSGELRIIAMALIIAVSGSAAINFFTERLQLGMESQASELIGADLVISSPHPIDSSWLEQANQLDLRQAQSIEYTNAVIANDEFALASIKAVSDQYPLNGALETSLQTFQLGQVTQGIPNAGECWIENKLLPLLKLSIGELLWVSGQTCKVSRIITFEPDRSSSVFSLSARVLIPLTDLNKKKLITPGRKVSFRYFFSGPPRLINAYKNQISPELEQSQKIVSVKDGRPEIRSALDRAERFLGLASLGAILLAGTAIAMGAQRYSYRHMDVSAMMRCFGASQNQILAIYSTQIFIFGIIASALGCCIGWVLQELLFLRLKDIMPENLPPPSLKPIYLSFITGMVILLGFALPPLIRLKKVPPLRVLKRDLMPLPTSAWLAYASAFSAIGFLMWKYTDSPILTVIVLGTTLAIIAFMGCIAYGLLRLAALSNHGVGVAWRFGIKNLVRRPLPSVAQILAFGSTFMAMAMIFLVRTDLLNAWQDQLPTDAPNHFAVNIAPEDADALDDFFITEEIKATPLYPIVRARLIKLNGSSIPTSMFDSLGGDGFLKRDLSLSESDQLPEYNHLLQGHWWDEDSTEKLVSVESMLSKRIGLSVGDQLTFVFGREEFQATVSNIRKVEWDSFRPNFYFIFSSATLADFPATYVTSFFLPQEQKFKLPTLIRRFPSTTFVEVEQILMQVKKILTQVGVAVEYVLAFVLAAGFAVLFSALQATLDERLFEGALLRALGANRRQLRSGHFAEYFSLGVLAGLMAAIGTEIIAYLLYTLIFHLDYHFKWQLWIICPFAGGIIIGCVGFWATRRISQQSPVIIFREV
ncbi:MAG: ABC transporter permease [Gammaproteobacteria bacterium]|nr:MAG: ABC transporter permease [Gammaproteobacteria bacterium]